MRRVKDAAEIEALRAAARAVDGIVDEMRDRPFGGRTESDVHRELVQRMLDAVGADGRALVWSAYSTSWGPRIGRDWPDDHVGPFVAHNLDWIVRESSAHQGWGIDEQAHFAAIAPLPRPPASNA